MTSFLTDRRKELGLTMKEVAEAVGVSEATVSRWESGAIANMRRDRIQALSKVLKVRPTYIMGLTEEPQKIKGAIPVTEQAMIPVLGRVCAGNGCLAQQEILYYEPADVKYSNGEYFYLKVTGDSMAPQICENDLLLIKSQISVDSGDVAVVLVDDMDGMVKKVIYDETNIHLISFNPYYPERHFKDSDVLRVRVIGKVIESKRKWA